MLIFTSMKKAIFCALAIMFCLGLGAQPENAGASLLSFSSRMNRQRLNIGTYILQPYAVSDANVRDAAACGIDFFAAMQYDTTALDLFEKYGIGAFVNGVMPGWWGGAGTPGTLSKVNPLEKYVAAAKSFKDHPAIWGIDYGDEPSALEFPHYGKIFRSISSITPTELPYLNLFPNYASTAENSAEKTKSQLATATYQEYIDEYCRYVPLDYICYDFYLYAINVSKAYENLRIVSDACRETGRSMWIVLQVNSNDSTKWISENELRFQAYTAMAFGAETIIWACYTAGWWYNQVLDDKGLKTQQYEKLKKVNAELHHLGDSYMNYRNTSTAFVGFKGRKWLDGVNQSAVDEFSSDWFSGLKATDGSELVVGSMIPRSRHGKSAVFVCSADDPYDEIHASHTLSFTSKARKVTVTTGTDVSTYRRGKDGRFSIPILSNQGMLIEIR